MIQIRKAEARGHFNHGWLDTYHTFSFARYYDPNFLGFRDLRVINEDVIAAGAGFQSHEHQNMEILTYVLEGELQHEDSRGHNSIVRPGDVQRMTAGTGIRHSEFNASKKNQLHLLQIWIMPQEMELTPDYEQKTFPEEARRNLWCTLASRDRKGASLKVHQDVIFSCSILEKGNAIHYAIGDRRHVWCQIARGSVKMNDLVLKASDGAAISLEKELSFRASQDAEILLFDMS